MSLTLGAVYSGFKVLQSDYVEEVQSQVYVMEHEQSGARLLYLANNDDNKVFHITFRTPPADDTGVAHILEHSSLCGSRKYHLKEPFVDLVKGSLNTFLNAMTYPDKTMYPVASRNDKDFHNLMDVYLDAVFYPLIYENPYTLRQEGWHYNLESADGPLSYNGVVYNEMKGVYSAPDAYLENATFKALFPDNAYRFESGGYPEAIPQLTQEAFLNFHKTYYSPENSFIYLYGDMDILETLAYMDREYLSSFTKTGLVHSEIAPQAPFARTKEVEACYPVAADEDCTGKTYHELSIVTGISTDVKTCLALKLLENVLLESESSPLKRALLEAGVGQNISGSFENCLLQPIFSIRASGSEKDMKDKFLSVIYKTLQELTIKGLDRELLEACLNSVEFKLRESDFGSYPKGLIYGIGVMENWLYGGNPVDGLKYNDYLKELREGLKTNYFENLIEQYLMDNTHKVLVTLVPKPGLEEENRQKELAKMEEMKASFTKEELERFAFECAELHRLQAIPDSEEARASIPILKRSDIRQEIETVPAEKEDCNGNTLLYVPAETNKITYLKYYFDITGIKPEMLPYVMLLVDVLGKFDTEDYTYQQLDTLGSKYTGGINLDARAISKALDADDYRIYFVLKAKVLTEKLDKLYELLSSTVLRSRLDNLDRFRELVAELKTDWDGDLFPQGQTIAISRLYSYCSEGARVNEQDLFSCYQFIKDLHENFENKGAEALAILKQLLPMVFRKQGVTLAYSCERESQAMVRQTALAFLDQLAEGRAADKPVPIAAPGLNEAITTAGKVQYVAAGGSFAKHGHNFTGAMKVLETILRYEYLWTKIRIQGGAYGATARFELNGLGVFASYRDPQLAKSLEAYKELPAWLKQVEFSSRELDKYVIGTISSADVPLTNSMKLDQAATVYLKGLSQELRQRNRNQILQVTNADLQALGKVVEDMLSDGYVCVVGGKQPIEENKDKFQTILNA